MESFFLRGLLAVFIVGSMGACDSSDDECGQLASAVVDAKNAFPDEWRACAVDSDCEGIPALVCAAGCSPSRVAKAHVDDVEAFMNNDPAVAKTCAKYNQSQCASKEEPFSPCSTNPPACVSGQCE